MTTQPSADSRLSTDALDGLLAQPVRGRHLQGPSLADNLSAGPNLLIFLRHFG
ncbi:MAG: hypothetical protein AAGD01_10710 [Acidobacteriota bacterium]